MSHATKLSIALFAAAFLAVISGCQTTQQTLAKTEPQATQTALARGKFDLGCPTATAVVLSSDLIQPAVQGAWVQGVTRLEYTVGVEGCGKRTTLVVMCQEGTGTCYAANPNQGYQNNGYQHP